MADQTLLDDLLDPAILASIKVKRATKARTDLSDLMGEPKPRPAAIEVLSPTSVILYVQENTCRCGAISEIPLGLVAMHAIKRHGRKSDDRVGVALSEPNEFPDVPRERDVQRSTSIVCQLCVERARHTPRITPSEYKPPQLDTPEWSEQFGYANSAEVHARAEVLRKRQNLLASMERTEERLARLEAIAENKVIVEALTSPAVEDPEEPTIPEDSQ